MRLHYLCRRVSPGRRRVSRPGRSASPTSAPQDAPSGQPEAVVDLATRGGVGPGPGESGVTPTRESSRSSSPGPGADNQPTGSPEKTYDYEPHAGGADFDDSQWEVIAPTSARPAALDGRLGFNWYRLAPHHSGAHRRRLDPAGPGRRLRDDARRLRRGLGRRRAAAYARAERRLDRRGLERAEPSRRRPRRASPASRSSSPSSASTVRCRTRRPTSSSCGTAKLEFYPGSSGPRRASRRARSTSRSCAWTRRSTRSCRPNPKIWKLAEGFQFTEGPVWVPAEKAATCCSAIRTATPSISYTPGRPPARCSGRRAAMRAPTSPSTDSPVRTASTLDRAGPAHDRPAWQSASRPPREGRREHRARRPLSRASGSTARTTWSTAPTARSTSPIRRSACRSSSTIRARSCRSAACTASERTASSQLRRPRS